MIKNATKEIQKMYPTVNEFHLQEQSYTLQLLKEMAKQNTELKIIILTLIDNSIKQSLSLLVLNIHNHNIQIQNIAPSILSK